VLYGPYQADGPRDYSQGTGAIRAFGEHKGSGLALICELLGGALTGNGATALNRPFANGMFSIYVDPKRVDTTTSSTARFRVTSAISRIPGRPPAPMPC